MNWYRWRQIWGILDWVSASWAWFLQDELSCRSNFHCHPDGYCSRWKSDRHWSHLSWEIQSISSPRRHNGEHWRHLCSPYKFCFLWQQCKKSMVFDSNTLTERHFHHRFHKKWSENYNIWFLAHRQIPKWRRDTKTTPLSFRFFREKCDKEKVKFPEEIL